MWSSKLWARMNHPVVSLDRAVLTWGVFQCLQLYEPSKGLGLIIIAILATFESLTHQDRNVKEVLSGRKPSFLSFLSPNFVFNLDFLFFNSSRSILCFCLFSCSYKLPSINWKHISLSSQKKFYPFFACVFNLILFH